MVFFVSHHLPTTNSKATIRRKTKKPHSKTHSVSAVEDSEEEGADGETNGRRRKVGKSKRVDKSVKRGSIIDSEAESEIESGDEEPPPLIKSPPKKKKSNKKKNEVPDFDLGVITRKIPIDAGKSHKDDERYSQEFARHMVCLIMTISK